MIAEPAPLTKIDRKRDLKHLYAAPTAASTIVDVPEFPFLMIDGRGDPNTSQAYRDAVASVFAVSYALKFALKRVPGGIDHAVMPLEGLWWVEDPSAFSLEDKSNWCWTAMVLQPEAITPELVAEAIAASRRRRSLPAEPRLERFREGPAAQVLHVGPFAEEPPTVARLDAFIAAQGYERTGKHHEIYLTDPSRTAPEKLRTVIRHPIRRPG